MKKLLMMLAISVFSFAVIAQTSSDPSSQGSSTEIMGAQEEVYPEGPASAPGSSSTVQEEEDNLDDSTLRDDSSTIQEEVETDSEETMRSDTMEGSTPSGMEGSSEGSSAP